MSFAQMEKDNTIDEEEFEDALSFCDLPLSDQSFESDFSGELSSSSTQDHFFEFSTSSSSSPSHRNSAAGDSIIFCGKRISPKSELTKNRSNKNTAINYSVPSLPQRAKNLRSQSTSGRKQKVMIGLAKIPSKMELSDLRERQNRKSVPPPPMFPAAVKGGESSVVSGNGSGKKNRSWGLLRPFRCKAQDLASTVAASSSSFGCLRLVRPWFD